MKSINKVMLLGHVGMAPKVVATAAGGILANFTLATSYRPKTTDGRPAEDVTEWHRLTAFGRTAEIVRDYVGKGAKLYIEGTLQTRVWEKDGDKRYSTEIIVRDLSLLDAKAAGVANSAGGVPVGAGADEEQAARLNAGITDNDIPF